MKRIPLHWKIIFGLVLGVIWAFVSSFIGLSNFTQNWISPWGDMFINLLKLIAVPLVLFSIIKGISSLSDIGRLGNLGIKTLLIYVGTTVMAVTVGLTLVNNIKPGSLVSEDQRIKNRLTYELWVAQNEGVEIKDGKSYLDKEQYSDFLDEAKKNLAQSGKELDLEQKIQTAKAQKEKGPLSFLVEIVPSNIFLTLTNNSLMLQVIFFAIFFGVCLIMIPEEKAKPLNRIIDSITEVFLRMVDVVMQAAPFFVFALLAGQVSKLAGDNPGQVVEIFKGLGWYSLVVLAGLALMIFVLYPILMKLFAKNIPYKKFFSGIGPAQMLAFSTSSSAATLPVTMECVRDNLGVSEEVTSFVLPIGATINMDGTSLYQSVAVLFLAQFHMVDLALGQQLMIVATATLASIGAAAVPSAGLIMMIIVLESVGLNPAWIAIIFPVDRILDMCRTVVNITGDSTVSSIIAQSEGELKPVAKT